MYLKHSIHHYCLREWLALADSRIAQTLKLKALPPPYMVEALDNHVIDGFVWESLGILKENF